MNRRNGKPSNVMTFIFTQVCAFLSTVNMLQKSYPHFLLPLPPLTRRYPGSEMFRGIPRMFAEFWSSLRSV